MHLKRIDMHLKHTKIYKYPSKPPKNVHIPPIGSPNDGADTFLGACIQKCTPGPLLSYIYIYIYIYWHR